MPIRDRLQIPNTAARQRWAASLKVGVDLGDILGIDGELANLALTGAAATANIEGLLATLKDAGTIESVDFAQTRKIKERYALGKNSLNSFQNIPQTVNSTLRLSRVVLKQLPEVEAAFNFLPSNLVLQQFPFVIELHDVGDGSGDTDIRHFCFQCWFTDTAVRYDTTSKDDTRLIQTATVNVGSVLTFDKSFAGNPVVQFASSVASLVLGSLDEQAEDVINDLNIS
jgi:hypothetical protein